MNGKQKKKLIEQTFSRYFDNNENISLRSDLAPASTRGSPFIKRRRLC